VKCLPLEELSDWQMAPSVAQLKIVPVEAQLMVLNGIILTYLKTSHQETASSQLMLNWLVGQNVQVLVKKQKEQNKSA